MRKTIALAVLLVCALAASAGFVPAADAAQARPAVPTCLISSGGSDGHFTHALTCVQVVESRWGRAGSGRYSPGDPGAHALTVSLEYKRPGFGPGRWLPLVSATDYGAGNLSATTRPVQEPRDVQIRACVTVAEVGHGHGHDGGPLCTA